MEVVGYFLVAALIQPLRIVVFPGSYYTTQCCFKLYRLIQGSLQKSEFKKVT